MRDSGLDISYALRAEAIAEKRASFQRATENGFKVGTYDELIPSADLVVNLTLTNSTRKWWQMSCR